MNEKTKSIFKVILGVLLVLVVVFIIDSIGKICIINDLQNKFEQYSTLSNYHIKTYQYSKDNLAITETLKKDDNFLVTYSFFDEENTRKLVLSPTESYVEVNGERVADTSSELSVPVVEKTIETDNLWDLISTAFSSSISVQGCNGKECYVITSTSNSDGIIDSTTRYIDKSTGLTVRIITTSSDAIGFINDYYYEFGNLTDEDFN